MTQAFANGKRLPATVLKVPTQVVTQLKTKDKDGYSAVQVAIGQKTKTANKPQASHLKKSGLKSAPRFVAEIKAETELKPGDTLPIYDIIGVQDTVNLTGTTLGKGFAGVMKRHGFAGGPRTHGQSDRGRAPGSVGRGTTPGRVLPGKKMAGHMGNITATLKGVQILDINQDLGEITIKGPVPGSRGSLIRLTITKKAENKAAAETNE